MQMLFLQIETDVPYVELELLRLKLVHLHKKDESLYTENYLD